MEIKNSPYLSNYSVDQTNFIIKNELFYAFPSGIDLSVNFVSTNIGYFTGYSSGKILVGHSRCSIILESYDIDRVFYFFEKNEKVLYYNELSMDKAYASIKGFIMEDLNSTQVNTIITLLEHHNEKEISLPLPYRTGRR